MSSLHPLLQQAQVFLTQENYEKVIELTTDIVESKFSTKEKPKPGMHPDGERLFALQLRCAAYIGNQDFADALSDAEIIIRLLPKSFLGYFYRGTALMHFDEIEEARDNFNHLLTLPLESSVKAGAYSSLGLADYIAGDYETALHHYHQALQLKPGKETLVATYGNMAIVYFRQHNMTAAWTAYKTAQQIDPNYDYALMGLAVLHAAEGQWDEALALWRKLESQHAFFTDLEQVVERYYRWTPPLADLVRQIAARANA